MRRINLGVKRHGDTDPSVRHYPFCIQRCDVNEQWKKLLTDNKRLTAQLAIAVEVLERLRPSTSEYAASIAIKALADIEKVK